MSRKARSDSVISKLAPSVRAELARMLSEANPSYDEAAAWLHKEHGVKIGRTAVRNWFVLHSWKENAEQARAVADQVAEHAAAPGHYDIATRNLVREKAYILARTPGADVQDLATLAGIVGESVKLDLKAREVALAERRVALLEKKAAQADEAKGAMQNAALTPAEREAKLKEIFGLR